MPYTKNPDAVAWETVFMALSSGVDLRTPARAVPTQKLLRLENGRFDTGSAGIRKRRGHVGNIVRDTVSLADTGDIAVSDPRYLDNQGNLVGELEGAGNYLYGYGVPATESFDGNALPDAGRCYGMASRDSESLVWDGWRLLSRPSQPLAGQGFGPPVTAYIPSAVTTPIAKGAATIQQTADVGVGNGIAMVGWLDPTNDRATITVYDPVTGAPWLTNQLLALTSVNQLRVIAMGDWVHVLVCSDTTLTMYGVHKSSPWTLETTYSFGSCNSNFDVRKVTDDLMIVVKRKTDGEVDSAQAYMLKGSGIDSEAYFEPGTTLTTTAEVMGNLAVAMHPVTNEICLVWYSEAIAPTGHYVLARVYTRLGQALGGEETVVIDLAEMPRLSVEANYLGKDNDAYASYFQVYYDDNTTVPITVVGQMVPGGYTVSTTRKYVLLASHAWRVGDACFVMLRSAIDVADTAHSLQQSYFVADQDLLPVGRLEYGTAQDSASIPTYLPSVHFDDGQGTRNRSKFHGILVYRTRVDSPDNDQYDENSLKLLRLDFLPKLRSAQFGRTTYFAGATLGCYDGVQYSEAAPLLYPEKHSAASSGVAGLPSGSSVYTYIVRWAWKNAQGEEQISPGVQVTMGAVNLLEKITVTIPALTLTRRTGVYALIYRNEPTGTQFFLVSSRDPALAATDNGYVANVITSTTLTFTDNMSDTALLSKEKNPGDSGLLEPFQPPACEVIAAGKDRLWLAGGEINPGYILPSLTYGYSRGAGFSSFLLTAVDHEIAPVTAFGFMGNSTFVFKQGAVYAFEASGPSNSGSGSFDPARVVLADTGARYQEGVLLCTKGILFPSDAGIKLLATNYQLIDVGAPVREEAVDSTISSGILIARDQEIRFYCANGPALVFNYETGEWSTWTGLPSMGAVVGANGLALLGRLNGYTWQETEDVWTDNGLGYEFAWQTAHLRGEGMQGYQRVRRVALVGDLRGAHSLRCNAYFNERDYPEDTWTWDVASDLNSAEWGDTTWGAGLWGDTNADIGGVGVVALQDGLYAHRHRLARQKCSRISLSFSDMGAPTEGPAFTEIAFEVGQRGGLSRLAPQTTS